MKNIVLTGFMGAGKSSVGRSLAKRLGLEVIDTDDVVEKDSEMKISDIFARFGESVFRGLERKAVEKISMLENHVIITGGGVVLNKDNILDLRRRGVIVYLHASPEVIYKRVKDDADRPLLQVKEPLKKIRELLEYRAPFYRDNDLEIDTTGLTVEKVASEIVKKVRPLLEV